MEEEEIVEAIRIGGRIFVPKDSVDAEAIKKEAIADYERHLNYKKEEEEEESRLMKRQSLRCKLCRCLCGCHPCKHTKVKQPTHKNPIDPQ